MVWLNEISWLPAESLKILPQRLQVQYSIFPFFVCVAAAASVLTRLCPRGLISSVLVLLQMEQVFFKLPGVVQAASSTSSEAQTWVCCTFTLQVAFKPLDVWTVIPTLPSEIPVTLPLFTVATEGLLLLQVQLVFAVEGVSVGFSVMVLPTSTTAEAAILTEVGGVPPELPPEEPPDELPSMVIL